MSTDMSKPIDPARSKAAAILGAKGGKAGTGAAKRRSPEAIRKAVQARIAAAKKRKQEAAKASARK